MTRINGSMWIGGVRVRGGKGGIRAVDPARGEAIKPLFGGATFADVEHACILAEAAFDPYRALPGNARATFLDAIADRIVALGDGLIERAMLETGLPRARLEGERARTCGQLRLFAGVVRDGSHLGVRIDPALPDRQPAPRPDLRLRHIPLGPVAIFGASNFPLAFSVAGADTTSALAAGCPVVVKAHPAHPGVSELVGSAIVEAAAATGMPAGVFTLLFDDGGHAIGGALVADPRIKAAGFTGSRAGGLALVERAAARPEPIPVYAEMSSINPVILLPVALAARGDVIAAAFVASLTLGAGQFCTNPGLVIGIDGPAFDVFAAAAGAAVAQAPAATMLTPGIASAYRSGVAALQDHADVRPLGRGIDGIGEAPALHETRAAAFLADVRLHAETFGASALLVRCQDAAELRTVVAALEGQLTVALHLDDADLPLARGLVPLLERKAGRLLVNGFGTGVEVTPAMVHGGPYPATSDSRTTSVGTLAIQRFLRPVCYQDFPAALLPEELG